MWCVEWPVHRHGSARTLSCSVASTALAIAVTISVSVVSGRCAPCCSKEPSGASTINLSTASAFTSGDVMVSSRISESGCPGVATGAQAARGLQDFGAVRGAGHFVGHCNMMPHRGQLFPQPRIEVRRDFKRFAGKRVDAWGHGCGPDARAVVDYALDKLCGDTDDTTPAARADGYVAIGQAHDHRADVV